MIKALLTVSLLLFALATQAESECKLRPFGIDTWPWAVAQPWKAVQGVWKLDTDKGDTYFNFRISTTLNKRKILLIDKIVDGNCLNPIASGVGYISSDERNIIRAVISDDNLRYQLKLAVFDTLDLSLEFKSGASSCGNQVVGISVMEVIGHDRRKKSSTCNYMQTEEPVEERMMLEKVSDSLASICKKMVNVKK